MQHVSHGHQLNHHLPTTSSWLHQQASFSLVKLLCEWNDKRCPLWRVWLISACGLMVTVKMWSYCDQQSLAFHLHIQVFSLTPAQDTHFALRLLHNAFLKKCVRCAVFFCLVLYFYVDSGHGWRAEGWQCSPTSILPVDGIKWLRRPAFLFTCSYLLAVAQDSLFITPSRMNCKLQLNILSHHFPL